MSRNNRLNKWFDRILKILIADQLPYLFTILIAITAYQLDHLINNISQTPIIEYNFETLNSRDSAGVQVDSIRVKIKNLNKIISFKNLEFDIQYSSLNTLKPADVYSADLIPVPPAPILPSDSDAYSWRSKYNHYRIPQLQPDGEYWVMLKTRHNKVFTDLPLIYLTSSDNVWLTSRNIETFIIRNQVWINIILIMLSFTMMILYANHVSKTKKENINEK